MVELVELVEFVKVVVVPSLVTLVTPYVIREVPSVRAPALTMSSAPDRHAAPRERRGRLTTPT